VIRAPVDGRRNGAARVLVVAAHPDDETLGVGGTIARYVDRGDEVWVCLLADGVTARHEEKQRQRQCAEEAARILGVKRLIFCDLPDQRLDGLALLDVIRPIEACVREFGPHLVFTHFGEDVNQDHRVAFRATMVATRPVDGSTVQSVLCFETPSSTEWAPPLPGSVFAPNVFVEILATLPRKLQAMRAYAHTFSNEVRAFPHPRSYEALETYAKRHGITVGLRAAEPFMLIRQLYPDGDPSWR
jgi:LmbE family N-acetylglucosaminyl deacetylase